MKPDLVKLLARYTIGEGGHASFPPDLLTSIFHGNDRLHGERYRGVFDIKPDGRVSFTKRPLQNSSARLSDVLRFFDTNKDELLELTGYDRNSYKEDPRGCTASATSALLWALANLDARCLPGPDGKPDDVDLADQRFMVEQIADGLEWALIALFEPAQEEERANLEFVKSIRLDVLHRENCLYRACGALAFLAARGKHLPPHIYSHDAEDPVPLLGQMLSGLADEFDRPPSPRTGREDAPKRGDYGDLMAAIEKQTDALLRDDMKTLSCEHDKATAALERLLSRALDMPVKLG